MAMVTIVGVGMGNIDTITLGGLKAIKSAQVLIAAKRLLAVFDWSTALKFEAFLAEDIVKIIEEQHDKNIVILVSGDVGFYSGAKNLYIALAAYKPNVISGISSLSYFCAKLKMSWDDVKVVSLHGREETFINIVRENPKVFLLLDHQHTVSWVCQKLMDYGLKAVDVYIGERLSYDDETIWYERPENCLGKNFSILAVMMIINQNCVKHLSSVGISDEAFIRSDVPMTKSEVRAVSISKLLLHNGDIVYDIGAGSGSVAIEVALQNPRSLVFAVEKEEKAVALIDKNCCHFGVDTVKIIKAKAPEGLNDLPIPDAVFIGGSAGNLQSIIEVVLAKNPYARIVINTITLESLTEAMEGLKKYCRDIEIVQLMVSKSKAVGKYQMMMGQNPVYILSGWGKEDYGNIE